MQQTSLDSGIQAVGQVPFGTHFCQFYQDRQDLIDTLVPFFMAGLRNHELCLWVTSEPLPAVEARELMREAMPGFDDYLAKGQIEIRDFQDWYQGETRTSEEVIQAWIERERQALAQGFTGLRLTGNTTWLDRSGWDEFVAYEAAVNETFPRFRILALCTYSLERCCEQEVMDVCRNHQFALARRQGEWEVLDCSSSRSLAARPAGLRILVVDDHEDAAETLGTILELSGHEVRLAYDGEQALALVRESRPDVVLLDIGLPKVDGYEVARRLRLDPRNEGMTLVAVTGYGREEERDRGIAAGFHHYLVKPVDPGVLQALLDEIAQIADNRRAHSLN
ncbi:MAG TPA: MEDS domain-containing protein [Thermoanaerobaculia bacterium]|jgi:CheY-like chemotaxis protein|nr:MEDS domain-containing protein [Thermoanaerobaculia bacterium]